MDLTQISKNIQNGLNIIFDTYPTLMSIVEEISKKNGRAILVGGAVRDLLLGLPVKDLDIEVHDITLRDLEDILKKFGIVSLVGKSFGVLKLHGLDIDWSLPRLDSKGRKPKVLIDPRMGFEDAFSRRDLTINAIGIDLETKELIDPFDGYNDLKRGILRAVNVQKFIEDPLRFFRVMQFIGRFEMIPDEQLNEICKKMDFSQVSVERIASEFEKLMLKSHRPSLGIRWLKTIGRLQEILPEIADIVDIPQDESWHPEGDVFEHTMQCVDAAASMQYDTEEQKLLAMYAILCHDLGKALTTEFIGGRWKSIGHSKEGQRLAKRLLKRITRKKDLIEGVNRLVKYHMSPVQLIASSAKPAAYKRLAKKLAPYATLELVAKVALADKQGRNPIKGTPLKKKFPTIEKFLKKARLAKVEKIPEKPILLGRDIMDIFEPGPEMGEFLRRAYDIQIEQGITDKETLKKMVLEKKE